MSRRREKPFRSPALLISYPPSTRTVSYGVPFHFDQELDFPAHNCSVGAPVHQSHGCLIAPPFADEATMVHASPGHAPKSGDVILRRTNGKSRRYTLSRSGEAPQITCTTFEEAIARADRFAQSQHVDVWQTDDGRAFTRLIECRLVSSASRAPARGDVRLSTSTGNTPHPRDHSG